jgi:hypothetical protein
MSAAPTIVYLLLDAQYDPVFDPSVELIDVQAVQQAIMTRLRLFLGEWWENMNLGLPVFQSMLGQLGSKATQAAINLAIQQQIEGVPYVTGCTDVVSQFENGVFSFSAVAQTSFGPVTINSLPANFASLG